MVYLLLIIQIKTISARIKKIVKKYSPEKLIILGDLFHSKYSIDKTLQKKVEDLPELLKTNVELVLAIMM